MSRRHLASLSLACSVLLFLTNGAPAAAQNNSPVPIQDDAQVAAWTADLDLFAAQLRIIHPNPFHGVSEEEFDQAMASLVSKLPFLRDDQYRVEVAHVAALISRQGRDGHTNALPFNSTALPLQFYLFSNGVYIVDALPPYQALIGSRVTHIGNAGIQTVLDRLDAGVPRDNEFSAKWIMGTVLVLTDVYSGLDLIDDRLNIPLRVEGATEGAPEVIIEPIALTDYDQWKELGANTLPEGTALYLSNTAPAFWFTRLEESGTLYIQYNHVFAVDAQGQTIAEFTDSLATAVSEPGVQRLVIDLRHNNGGDNTTYGPLLELLSENPLINRPDFLYVIAGRQTFSAAMNFAADVESSTQAIFVGEGTGGSPMHYGDSEVLFLPGSGIQLNISSRTHASPVPDDPRLSILPDIAAGLSSQQYYGNIDPAMDAVLRSPSCVDHDFADNENQVLNAYIAYYGRPADPGGLAFWVNRLEDEGGNLSSIIDAFGFSQEFVDRFGSLDSEELVTRIYQQLFSRDPDPAGLDWFVGQLQSGARSLQTISLDIFGGAQNEDLQTINNRNAVARHFVRQLESSNIALPDTLYNELLETVDNAPATATLACELVNTTIVSLGGVLGD